MIPAPLPTDEADRLAALERYGILDTAPEARFDRITRLAQTLFDVPIALVSLVDRDRQWFKSCIGLDVLETGRDAAFCAHAILADGVTEVLDPEGDPRFADNPLVTGPPHIRYYAGAPLITPDGFALGTLCIIDQRTRAPLTPHDRATLRDLADVVVDDLELRNLLGETHTVKLEESAANASKMEFLAWLSHELKTPLTAVRGFADTLLLTDLDDAQVQFTQYIIKAGIRIDDLISDILDFARLEAGRLSVEVEDVTLGAVGREVATLLQERARQRDIEIHVDPSLDGITVAADERRVLQILNNLVSNAIKYNREAGRVDVRAELVGGMAAISVSDTGAGIAPEHQQLIFEAFERVPGTDKPGAGIGLALCTWLARQMGGDVRLASTGPAGSTFVLRLPLAG